MAKHISNNPQFTVNGFRRSGVSRALDGYRYDPENLEKEIEDLSDDPEEEPEGQEEP